MKEAGLQKARRRLKQAFEAAEQLRRCTNWDEYDEAWSRFLTALSAVYEILKASSRGCSKSEGWFSRVEGDRRTDELLSYLRHARNANNHGIAEVLNIQKGGVGIGSRTREKALFVKELVVGDDGHIERLEGSYEDGSPIDVHHYPERVVLVPVTDRGQEYQPPKSFRGEPLKDVSPDVLARLVLEFMTRLFGEAEALVAQALD